MFYKHTNDTMLCFVNCFKAKRDTFEKSIDLRIELNFFVAHSVMKIASHITKLTCGPSVFIEQKKKK